MAEDERRVALADKLHNGRALLRDRRAVGDALWQRFNAGRDGHACGASDLLVLGEPGLSKS